IGQSVSVGVLFVGNQSAAECVRTRHRRLQCGPGRREPLQPLEFVDDAQSAWCAQSFHDLVFAALIVCRWPEPARRCSFELDTFEKSVEGEIKVEPRLLTI